MLLVHTRGSGSLTHMYTRTHSESGMNGMLTLAGLCPKRLLKHVKEAL